MQAAVVTDRPCGIECFCAKTGIPVRRIVESESKAFSAEAAVWLYDEQMVDWTALFFTRLVDESLYSRAACINFHPSLLPAFPGFGALKKMQTSGTRFFGATAHIVDQALDGGAILAQTIAPLPTQATQALLERISFAQKLYLMLVICEMADRGKDQFGQINFNRLSNLHCTYFASPKLQNANVEKAFLDFVVDQNIPWPQ